MKGGLTKSQFEKLFKEGKRVQGDLVRLLALPGDGRLGIATSKKIGNKPDRNRCKRRIREAFKAQPTRPHFGLDIVVVAFEASANAPFQQIANEVSRLTSELEKRWANELASS
ncbi:MAG TPA: ribonuclease P protein component [Fimbriimonadaceae bacterium]|nr:ribonuclease P protein component [Fimbriimonadaceae bacterium]